jgi:hypothetical protein
MTDIAELQAIVDELAEAVRLAAGNVVLGPTMEALVLAAATKRPKHPTPDQFIDIAPARLHFSADAGPCIDLKESHDVVGKDSATYRNILACDLHPPILRQLDAALHAIRWLRATVDPDEKLGAFGECCENCDARHFLRALDAGEDFPGVP